ncbi:MAG: peptidoglycan DD-metalloendopeptidase family protein [Bryobacteraceae bacterium]
MKQEYFVVVVAHSLRGRLRRIHIPHQAVYAILALALLGGISVFGFVASYARMAWKVANYNNLRTDFGALRVRYQSLQKEVSQTNQQLASLELYANEVSAVFGLKQKLQGPSDIAAQGKLVPSYAESVQDYNFLRNANTLSLLTSSSRRVHPLNGTPNLWPIDGRLLSGFGQRNDPFGDEGEFHKGVDLGAPVGTPVHVTADGVVRFADRQSGYGLVVMVDHGGIETLYAHLSKMYVHSGQEIRRGELVGAVGTTGRVTAPHLHYEVHLNGRPVNPYQFLAKSNVFHQVAKDFPF